MACARDLPNIPIVCAHGSSLGTRRPPMDCFRLVTHGSQLQWSQQHGSRTFPLASCSEGLDHSEQQQRQTPGGRRELAALAGRGQRTAGRKQTGGRWPQRDDHQHDAAQSGEADPDATSTARTSSCGGCSTPSPSAGSTGSSHAGPPQGHRHTGVRNWRGVPLCRSGSPCGATCTAMARGGPTAAGGRRECAGACAAPCRPAGAGLAPLRRARRLRRR
mmetsp:Transcript_110499/g.323241  ORF Transcript_110499/g.323241 Transcript_110499/m.323241 type:complete len:218 (-) Transcript_110499:457-1110(-)